ncbi:GlsB/YeaQ/YmgE family stress response membrane protein [Xanthobacter sp. KR7-225]|uniref:GlsB/YeaQ/YmgE family stress response membrane protein n=1 Tax=Xanthobacter sp. KR7-225 TaxID=3156613 RepID=UPI0032B3520B
MNDQAYAFLGQPGVGFFSMLLIGVIAGWVAERITDSNHGLLTNLIVGVAGAFVGGELGALLNIQVFGFFRTLVAAIIGAIILLWAWRALRGR